MELDRDWNFEAGSFRLFYYDWNLEYRTLYPGSLYTVQFIETELQGEKLSETNILNLFIDRRNFTAK